MSISSNTVLADPVHRLVVKLVVATAAVAVTAAIVFNDRPVPESRHAPLSETASTSTPDTTEATGPTTTAAAAEPGARP
jgi:hypothetical protein